MHRLRDPGWAGLRSFHLSPGSSSPRPRCRPTYLASGHLLLLGDPEQQPIILQLQRADTVDVVCQAVVELTELLLLLQPRQTRGRQRRGGPRVGRQRRHGGGGGGGRITSVARMRRAHSIRAAEDGAAARSAPEFVVSLARSTQGAVVHRAACEACQEM
ncbi:mCG148082 [Mus musculus]|nr:mCG148082 [Mus musculus]